MLDTASRLARLTDSLSSLGLDAFLVTDEINVRYLSGFTGDSSYLLVTPAEAIIISDGRYEIQIAEQCPNLQAIIRPPHQSLADRTIECLSDSEARRVGIESEQLTVSTFRQLRRGCPEVEFVETSGTVQQQRVIKDAEEIETIRKAVGIAEQAFQQIRPRLSPELTEREIAFEIESVMRSLGASGCSFAPIIAAGANGAHPHYEPSAVSIGEEASLLIDWGANYQGYASDLTRTLHREHASDDFRRAYDAVLEAQMAAIETISDGVAASDVDQAARKVLRRYGLEEAFNHGLGHGIGLQIHEAPRMAASATDTLQSGMVVTVEPGVYFAGRFGIRIEDDVLVLAEGQEVLSSLPKGLDDCRLIL